VWLFPRAIPGSKTAPAVCQLVNWDYDAGKNHATPQKDVKIRLRGKLTGDSPVTKVTYHTIGEPPQPLAFAARENAVHVTVPEVELWGVVTMEH
jgi:hypothetical protein